MSPVNSMFVCIIKKKKKKISANLFWKWPISIIGKMLNIGADNRSTPIIDILVKLILKLVIKLTIIKISLILIKQQKTINHSLLFTEGLL